MSLQIGGLSAMRRVRVDDIFRWCRQRLPDQSRRSAGNIALYMALVLTSLVGLAGAGVDYGLIVVETSRLQNAVDAASLAGAKSLVTSTGSSQTVRNTDGDTKAREFLALHNYTVGTLPTTDTNETVNSVTWNCRTGTDSATSTTFKFCGTSSDDTAGASNDTMKVSGTIVLPTRFWRIIGINSTTITRESTAVASGGMVDVMLSIDLTGSMEASGTNDMMYLRQAVVAFINQMQLSTTDPRGSQVGIARWAGTVCSWYRGPGSGANGDRTIDFDHGPSSTTGEYSAPCTGDATVLSFLTSDTARLTKIADGTGGGSCPSAPAAPATPTQYSPGSMSQYACNLKVYDYPWTAIPMITTPTPSGTPTTATGIDSNWSSTTGTNLSNALKIVNGNLTGCYAWATSTTACPTNGRNNAATTGLARKVLVIITDGFSQKPLAGLPSNYTSPSTWNSDAVTLANALKRGPDGDITTLDDNVEIYVVGFFCVHYDDDPSEFNWCRSRAADTGTVDGPTYHPCPNATLPTAASHKFSYDSNSVDPGVDELLNNISSSKSGSCDHYFPIAKSEGSKLPTLFRVMAGSIARGRLQ
jgi:Flp pilus assembly protein TadG